MILTYKISIRSDFPAYIQLGEVSEVIGVRGNILAYRTTLNHKLLNQYKEVKAAEMFLLQQKVDAIIKQWDARTVTAQQKNQVANGKAEADNQTVQAAEKLKALSFILKHTLSVNDRINWENLKDFSKFSESPEFREPMPLRKRTSKPAPIEAHISFWDRLFGKAEKKLASARSAYDEAFEAWRREDISHQKDYDREFAEWVARKDKFNLDYIRRKQDFESTQYKNNEIIDRLRDGVVAGDISSIIDHISIVLEVSDYNGLFEKFFDIDYQPDKNLLLIEYRLPSPDDMPKIKSVRFIAANGEMKETFISEREQKSNYDNVCYQICLRTLHEVFEADEHDHIQRILFNGVSEFIDRATGQQVSSIIMSVLVDRASFTAIDLARVDPKVCFKSLKGVSAASLAALAPIAPVMKFDKEDRRFIEARGVSENLDDRTNLAAMDWEEFEHLVREVFEKEFSRRGGEVKITQSSSDGGVDAVAYDPDPITGGKIVIQAKRYTRTVGVAAVRDLYGTMQHERASRGILVTTTDYGPDAYQFCSDKPITLMTGANLLFLLERHGIEAKIDVAEARREMNLRELR